MTVLLHATLMIFSILTEYTKRYEIFVDNMKKIQVLNENERGTATYGPNKFSDLTGIHTRIIGAAFYEGSEVSVQGPRGSNKQCNFKKIPRQFQTKT